MFSDEEVFPSKGRPQKITNHIFLIPQRADFSDKFDLLFVLVNTIQKISKNYISHCKFDSVQITLKK